LSISYDPGSGNSPFGFGWTLRVAGQEPRFAVTLTQQETLLHEFLAASTTGDVDRLAAILSKEVSLVRDGDNLGVPAPAPIHGARAVAEIVAKQIQSLVRPGSMVKRARFQDAPLLLLYVQNELLGALALVLRGDHVQTLYSITCPIRLRSLAAQCPPA
jgi:RNA polymerase sigma-70 factor (ECF subfamily)